MPIDDSMFFKWVYQDIYKFSITAWQLSNNKKEEIFISLCAVRCLLCLRVVKYTRLFKKAVLNSSVSYYLHSNPSFLKTKQYTPVSFAMVAYLPLPVLLNSSLLSAL
ncbi:hypothetical protein BABINDRAFT_118726 [Babjeviella inositovora NRRL Y-12698]|uniref:Uncharacterized protein n=1 Tax=Babjeviella inositovora NRRL Y-12698 TaxID=984486 RepID=A0A1E3QTE2_9ASCO|nr:uncharacterized protein BABINDRAFT_118726 [Babjeviella inositovora NRRL Y-12698]ODQ80975.1 hypothetical protein BABINDRAFT_118726 [Babjeviella inositovora NRRL Y-12698]